MAAPPAPAPAPVASAATGGTPVLLPALGESVTEGTVTRWLKAIGDEVRVDEPLLEISTDKVDTEIPSPASGILIEITVGEDGVVQVGGQLGVIGSGVAALTVPAAPAPIPLTPPAPPSTPTFIEQTIAPVVISEQPAPVAPAYEAIPAADHATLQNADAYATPLVRKLAAEQIGRAHV